MVIVSLGGVGTPKHRHNLSPRLFLGLVDGLPCLPDGQPGDGDLSPGARNAPRRRRLVDNAGVEETLGFLHVARHLFTVKINRSAVIDWVVSRSDGRSNGSDRLVGRSLLIDRSVDIDWSVGSDWSVDR